MKRCSSCKQLLEDTMFYKCTARKDGLQNHCKPCQNFASNKHAKAKRDAQREVQDKWDLYFDPAQLTALVYEPMPISRANKLLQPYGYRLQPDGDFIHVPTGEVLAHRTTLKYLRAQLLPQLVPDIDWMLGFPRLLTTLERAVA